MRPSGWRAASAAICLATLAAGCSDSSDLGAGSSPVTIAFVQHGNPTYDTANSAAFRAYEKAHSNVTIKTTTIEYESLTAGLLADLKNDHYAADLVQIPGNWICSFAANVADVPPEVLAMADAPKTFFAPVLAAATCNGVLKGIPLEYNLEYGGVVLNVDKYQARFAGKTPSWADWRGFISEAAALAEFDTDGTPKVNGLDIDPNWAGPAVYIFLSAIRQRGGRYWTASMDAFSLKTPEARDSITDIASWITKDRVMSLSLCPNTGPGSFVTTRLTSGATGVGWGDPLKPLSVMGYVGSWGLSTVRQSLPAGQHANFDYFVLPPMVGTQQKFITYGGWVFAVPKTSKNQKVAWDIVKSLALDPAAMKQWSATTTSLPALLANGSAEATAGAPLLSKIQPLLANGEYMGYIPAGAIQDMEGAILTNIFAVVRGTKDVDTALGDMESAINMSFARNR